MITHLTLENLISLFVILGKNDILLSNQSMPMDNVKRAVCGLRYEIN
jgi:hypothetical protein